MLFNKNLDYTIFKVFVCACFPLLRPYNRNKFDFRSQQCLFLRYSVNNKGYICRTSSGKTIVSRHVHFNEIEFSYHEQLNYFSYFICFNVFTFDYTPYSYCYSF